MTTHNLFVVPAPQGDVYVEPYSLQKDLSQRSNQLHSKPFVPVGGTKKPSGSGSLWGVFGKPGELLDTDASLGAHSGRPRLTSADHKKNIYVRGMVRGRVDGMTAHR
jgi:hypothetical protein